MRSVRDRLMGWTVGGLSVALFLAIAGHIVIRKWSPPPPGVGDVAPAFVLDSVVDGEQISTEALSGMVLLVDFWETTCVGCVGATPKLNRLFEAYRDQGFLIIGVHRTVDEITEVQAFVRERPVHYPVVVDPGHVAQAYGIYATPTVLVIGADGRIRHKHIGPVTEDKLAQEIEAALKAARPKLGRRPLNQNLRAPTRA